MRNLDAHLAYKFYAPRARREAVFWCSRHRVADVVSAGLTRSAIRFSRKSVHVCDYDKCTNPSRKGVLLEAATAGDAISVEMLIARKLDYVIGH